MAPPRRGGRRARGTRSSPRARPIAGALAALLLPACAAHAGGAGARAQPEVLVEVLPRGAGLTVDGVPLGPGARTVPLPEPARLYSFRASAPGFEPAERVGRGAALAGTRVGLALRPVGVEGRVDLDDAASLARVADVLLARGRRAEALEYAARAAEAAPRAPALRRLAGRAAAAAGDRDRALAEYRAYLTLAPDAADRAEIASEMDAVRVPAAAPGVEVRRAAPAAGGRR